MSYHFHLFPISLLINKIIMKMKIFTCNFKLIAKFYVLLVYSRGGPLIGPREIPQ
jgi:hypothetical protein